MADVARRTRKMTQILDSVPQSHSLKKHRQTFEKKSLKRQGEEILWYMWAIPSTHHEDSKLGRLEGLVFLREISREKRCMALYGGWSL